MSAVDDRPSLLEQLREALLDHHAGRETVGALLVSSLTCSGGPAAIGPLSLASFIDSALQEATYIVHVAETAIDADDDSHELSNALFCGRHRILALAKIAARVISELDANEPDVELAK